MTISIFDVRNSTSRSYVQNGKMSQHIAHLKPGETLSFKGPIAKYAYKPNEFAHGFAIGGGSGITPMYQMISHSLTLPNDNTKWTLMFANVTDKDIRGFFRRVN